MRALVPLVMGALGLLALFAPYKGPMGDGTMGSVWTEIVMDFITNGGGGGRTLALLVVAGAFLPAVGLTLAVTPGGPTLRSLQRAAGAAAVLYGLALYVAIELSLTLFSFSGGRADHNGLVYALPAAFVLTGLASLIIRPRMTTAMDSEF